MEPKYIVVQAGGKGTRLEHLTRNKPKALVPVGNRPMLFHLFEQFPDKKYIVIGDYKCDVLKGYLTVFAGVDYTVVDAGGKTGTCAGLGESVDQIPAGEPFLLIWCDLVLPEDFQIPAEQANYIGISKDFPCRWRYERGRFDEVRSIEHGVAGLFLFKDKAELRDVPAEGEFVRWLCEKNLVFRELPLCRTKEYGILREYQQRESGRCRPFNRLTIDGEVVIKEGIDAQGRALAARERAWYTQVIGQGFPNVPQIYTLAPLKMERIHGKNIFAYTLDHTEKRRVLEELIGCLRAVHALGEIPAEPESYEEAYLGKTFARLERIRALVPLAEEPLITINGKKCRNVFFHQEELKALTARYLPKTFQLIHGDCTFSNILLRDDKTPVMIDPRGYFGFTELYGDPAYDWAKLYYSIVGNYDQFNLKRFSLEIEDDGVRLMISSNHWEDMERDFFALLGEEICETQIKLFHAIIWLSLTTYAWEDYDSICGAFYNGLLWLEEVL